jgi:hypothetical protein
VIAIAALGFKQGVPQTLIYGLDYAGHVCGKNNKARGACACDIGRYASFTCAGGAAWTRGRGSAARPAFKRLARP